MSAGVVPAEDQPAAVGPAGTAQEQSEGGETAPGSSVNQTDQIVRAAWEKLYAAEFGEDRPGCSFDYGPNGMRNIYCYFSTVISYEDLLKMAGMDPFVSGPHGNRQLNLNSRNSFGHYNPEFVQWMNDHLIPAVGDENFRWISDPLYQRYLKRTARTYYLMAKDLFANQVLLEAQAVKYRRIIAGPGLEFVSFPEIIGIFKQEYIDRYLDGDYYYYNVVDASAGFWLRRYIDGTWPLFQEGLSKLLGAYDPDFVKSIGDLPIAVSTTSKPLNTTEATPENDPTLKRILGELRGAVEQHNWQAVLIFFEPDNYREQMETGQTTPRYIMEGLGLGWTHSQLIPRPDDNSEYSLLNSIDQISFEKVGPPESDGLFTVTGQVTLFDGSVRRLEFQMIRTITGGYFISPALG
jgi:hypothetical protein